MRIPTQPPLPLDHGPALEAEMRVFYDTRWRRWHRAHNFDRAMEDPVTKKLLELTVLHLPHQKRGKR